MERGDRAANNRHIDDDEDVSRRWEVTYHGVTCDTVIGQDGNQEHYSGNFESANEGLCTQHPQSHTLASRSRECCGRSRHASSRDRIAREATVYNGDSDLPIRKGVDYSPP